MQIIWRRIKAAATGAAVLLLTFLLMTGCAGGTKAADKTAGKTGGQNEAGTAPSAVNIAKQGGTGTMPDNRMLIKVISGQKEIVFALNDTSASNSLYQQLPLIVTIENYGSNEKVFQPPRKLNCVKAQEGACPTGSIAYFAPWNNVCMFYGDAPHYSGLYVIGKAVKNAEQIQYLSGTVRIEAN